MRSGAYTYPADEFDAAARSGGPRGVHRAPRSRWSRWWPFLVVLVVFPALAYGIVTFLSDWDGFDSLGGSDSGQQQAPATGTDTDGTDPATGEDDGTGEDPEQTPTETEPAPPPPPPLDLSRPVEVFNSTNTSGLARNAQDRLAAVGFTTISVADWQGEDPPTSVIYYGVATDRTTAEQIASTLGLPATALVESAEQAAAGIVVVLADDYVRADV